jgi:hypothetical protein
MLLGHFLCSRWNVMLQWYALCWWFGQRARWWCLTFATAQEFALTIFAQRADQKNMTKAHEYLDTPEVFEAKCALIAQMLRTPVNGQNTTIYSGAGISRGAGIAGKTMRFCSLFVVVDKPARLREQQDQGFSVQQWCAQTG